MFQATRSRLALWYTAVTAILLFLFATGIYFYVRSALIDRIDDTLKHVIEVIERGIVLEKTSTTPEKYQVNVEATFLPHYGAINTVEDDHIDLEWFSPKGRLLWSTLNESLVIPLSFQSGGKTIRISADYLLRQVTKKVAIGDSVLGYLRVSHPWFDLIKPIRRLVIDLTLGIFLTIVSVAAIGWFLSGIAIQPVKESYQSLKQFTADASHELRNPIAMIQANIQMLLSYPDTEFTIQQQRLKVLERLTKRLGTLVDDLLFLARADSGIVKLEFQSVPLDALLIEVIEEQRIAAEAKKIKLSLEILTPNQDYFPSSQINQNAGIEEDIFMIQGDWNQLVRLFTNLICNALTHSFADGNSPHPAAVKVILAMVKKNNKNYYQVGVGDNGAGISPDALPHIFDRFYRFDSSRRQLPPTDSSPCSGTGLGLAIAKTIVENHQGIIEVESNLGRGTTFRVNLPAPPSIISPKA